jgi:hypothetical protein
MAAKTNNDVQQIGENIGVSVEGDIITLTMDKNMALGMSGSGKSMIVATTRGNASVPGTDLTLGLNLYRKQ